MTALENLQGQWQAVWLEDDGRKPPPWEIRQTRVTIAGDRYVLHRGDHAFQGTIIRCDPSSIPGEIDCYRAGGPDGAGKTYPGIFLLEGDELTICVAPSGKPRPMDFDSRRGTGYWLYLLRRLTPGPLAAGGEVRSRGETRQLVSPSRA